MKAATPIELRIAAKFSVQHETGCQIWQGSLDRHGYGQIFAGGKTFRVHRLNYILAKGELDVSVKLDHLCRNRACINPDHLDPVSDRVNILRGESFSAVNARKTHCDHGHEFSKTNTHFSKKRNCRACACVRSRAYAAKKALGK